MVVEVGNIKVEFKPVNQSRLVGATIIQPDGTKDYGEYINVKDAMNRAMKILKGTKQ